MGSVKAQVSIGHFSKSFIEVGYCLLHTINILWEGYRIYSTHYNTLKTIL